MRRASGILLHPTSLPSRHGVGDLGRSAYEFVDFLARSGQTLWQILPLGPTGYEHSPYIMNFSTFAGNPLLVSLEQLAAEGWLALEDLTPIEIDTPEIDFDRVIAHKLPHLDRAAERFRASLLHASHPEFEAFRASAPWLKDYALFMALLEAHDYQPWTTWERAIAHREPNALNHWAERLCDRLWHHQIVQFFFFQQWTALRHYANAQGIQIIGDISIYVCHNSVEVWTHPHLFQLDETTLEPTFVAGVPPDYFSETGQLWGNPVYNWDALRQTRYQWWIERFRATLQYVDWVRIDHFRGFEAFWRIPASEATALNGEWIPAPGIDFFETLRSTLGNLPILAEDLGIITPDVEALRDRFELPGMRILLFAFGGEADHPYLPHHYPCRTIVYTGTHDNDTTVGWWQRASLAEKQHVADYLGVDGIEAIAEIHWTLIRLALSSVANWAIIPLQDVFGLDNCARMNDPSTPLGNWRWRYVSSELLTPELSDRLLSLTRLYSR